MSITTAGLSRTAFATTAFIFAVISMNWPFVSIYGRYGLKASYYGIFILWFIHIAILFLMSQAHNQTGMSLDDRSNQDYRGG